MKGTLRAVVPRAFLGGALMSVTLWQPFRHHHLNDSALDWTPLLQSLWALGVLTLVHCMWWAWRRREPLALPTPPGWVEVIFLTMFTALSFATMWGWAAVANPDLHLSGNDYDTYALNTIAVKTGDWKLFIPDKHLFHARVVAALWDGGAGLSGMLVRVSVAATALLPLGAWAMARRGAGVFAGILAATLTLAFPLIFRFATQTTAYPLFYLLAGVAAAAVVWAIQAPSAGSAVVAGLVAGCGAATQEKTMIVLLPVVGVAVILALPSWWRAAAGQRRRGLGLAFMRMSLGIGAFAAVVYASAPPRGYTPMVSLVTNQRQEVHVSLPYDWPAVKHPDLGDPAGVRSWLPKPLWDGEIESWIASLRTPPDSNSLSLTRTGDGRPVVWREIAGTTIPPLEVRVRANLLTLPSVTGPLPWPGLWLVVTGTLALLLFGRGRARVAAALALGFASAIAPLTLRFGDHYVLHVLPFAAALAVAGYDRLVQWLLPGPATLAGRGVLLYLFGAYALGCWTDDPEAWRAPTLTFPPPSAHAKEDPGGYAGNLAALSAWLDTQDPTRPLADCLPGGLLMVRPEDPRFTHGEAQKACPEALREATPSRWLLVSSHGEYRKANQPDPGVLLRSGRWKLRWGYDVARGTVEDGRFLLPPSAVIVLEAVEGGAADPAPDASFAAPPAPAAP